MGGLSIVVIRARIFVIGSFVLGFFVLEGLCQYPRHRRGGGLSPHHIPTLSTVDYKHPILLWLQIPVIARLNIMSSIMKFLRHKGGVIAAAAQIKFHRYAIITEIL